MNGTIAQTAAWSPARTYALEAKYEFLKLLRMPGYAIPSIAFPAMFYLLFGVLFGRGTVGGVSMPTYLIATYGAFGVIGASLFGFGVGVAVERGQGWMLLKRASPMPPMAFFAAKLVMCAVFAATIVTVLGVLGIAFGNVRMPSATWLRLGVTLVLGAVPFCALGLGLGYLVGPERRAADREPHLPADVVPLRLVDSDRRDAAARQGDRAVPPRLPPRPARPRRHRRQRRRAGLEPRRRARRLHARRPRPRALGVQAR